MEIVLGRGFSVAVDGEITYKGLFSLRLHGLNVKKREEKRERERYSLKYGGLLFRIGLFENFKLSPIVGPRGFSSTAGSTSPLQPARVSRTTNKRVQPLSLKAATDIRTHWGRKKGDRGP